MKNKLAVSGGKSKVLVVDDDSMIRAFYSAVLSGEYDVHETGSGLEAVAACKNLSPDLILLDVDMPGMNGYETCRKLREFSAAPIVFATAHQTLEEHLKAFDSGGDDILTKPLVPEILLFKVELAIKQKHVREELIEEKISLQSRMTNYLSSMEESSVMLNFVRGSLTCRSYAELAQKLVDAIRDFGLEGSVVIRHGGNVSYMTTHGEPSALEISILEKSSSMGRVFQFKHNLAVNYDKVSIVVNGLPGKEDEIASHRISENLGILAKTAEAFCENVDMRQVSMERAENMQIALFEATKSIEQIRDTQTQLLMGVRLLLHKLTDKIEQSYSWLGTSSDQETAISAAMNESVQQILDVMETGNQMNSQFATIVNILRGGDKQSEVDLF